MQVPTELPENREVWHTRARRSIVTDRGEEHYNDVFDADFEGEGLILDLGPGMSKYAPDSMVRLDYFKRGTHHSPHGDKNVAGMFQELPFKSESFDGAVASWSLLKLKEGAYQGVSEALRVIRPGGVLEIYPVNARHGRRAKALLSGPYAEQHFEKSRTWTAIKQGGVSYAVAAEFGLAAFGFRSWDVVPSVVGGLIEGTYRSWRPNGTLAVQRAPEFSDEDTRMQFVAELLDAFSIVASTRRDKKIMGRLALRGNKIEHDDDIV